MPISEFCIRKKFYIVFWGLVLLSALNCLVQWFYLYHQNYYIVLSDALPRAFDLAKYSNIGSMIHSIFVGCECGVQTRPFFTALSYAIFFKLFNFNVFAPFFLGIFFSSILVSLYFILIYNFFNLRISLFSSVFLIFMTNFIEQSLGLTTILPGIIFLLLALIAYIHNNRSDRNSWVGFLGWFFLSISVFCRFENVLFVIFFIVHDILVNKNNSICKKFLNWVVGLSGFFYICVCNFIKTKNPFSFIINQSVNAFSDLKSVLTFSQANHIIGGLLSKLVAWPFWIIGLFGVILILIRYKKNVYVLISAFIVYFIFLYLKLKNATLCPDENYFFILTILIIPSGFMFLDYLLSKCLKKGATIFLIGVIFLSVIKFNKDNLLFNKLKYNASLIKITEDLRNITKNRQLYILDDDATFPEPVAQSMLYYLGLNPEEYFYPRNKPSKGSVFYFLTPKHLLRGVAKNRKYKLVKDFVYKDLALFEITDL